LYHHICFGIATVGANLVFAHDGIHRTRAGYTIGDNVGYLVDLPHRKSFSIDTAFYTGKPTGMRFLEGAPNLCGGSSHLSTIPHGHPASIAR
jgi:hypothetical protein